MIREQSVKAILAPLGPTGVRFELTNRSDHREDRRPDVFGQGIPPIDEFLEGLRSRVPGAGHTSGRGGIRFADISRFPVPFRGYFAILVPVRVRCEFWFCRLVRLAAGSISFGVYALWRVLSVRLPGESLARQRRRWKSNPPGALLPQSGFEDRQGHRALSSPIGNDDIPKYPMTKHKMLRPLIVNA